MLGENGSILGYNTKFEIARLTECAGFFPEYQSWCDKTLPRFIDLLDVFDSLDYYDPAQSGSASLKAVLPALTGKSYADLKIQDGEAAGREFMRITFGDVALRRTAEGATATGGILPARYAGIDRHFTRAAAAGCIETALADTTDNEWRRLFSFQHWIWARFAAAAQAGVHSLNNWGIL